MAVVGFKFRTDLLKAFWEKYELQIGIDAVIGQAKNLHTKFDVIKLLGLIGDAFKGTEAISLAFLQDEKFRDTVAGELDEIFEFSGILGVMIETLDKKLIKDLLDMMAAPVDEVEEE